MKEIIILGIGGNCIDILDTINDIGTVYKCVGFLDDKRENWGKEFFGVKVLGPLDSAKNYANAHFVNGIGSPFNFWKKGEIIARTGIPIERFENIIHPTASVSKMARLAHGVVIFQNVTITSNVSIGNHVIILPNSVISHDDVIGDCTSIAGGAAISGQVTVGRHCYLGTNSTVIGNVKIGDNCMVGMGSVVLHDVPENQTVVGNPAKFLRNTR